MKLGRDTGSITNYLMSGTVGQPLPAVGMGVTLLSWTDRHPGTIVDTFEHGRYLFIAVTEDSYVRTDNNGWSESQEYEYTSRPEGHRTYFRRLLADPNAPFHGCTKGPSGRWSKNGERIRIGEREKYHDFSF